MKKNIIIQLFFSVSYILNCYAEPTDQCPAQFLGNWKLVSNYKMEKGTITYPYGPNAVGYITYGSDDLMSVQMMGDGSNASAPNNDYFAYYGNYQIDCGKKVIHHYLIGSLNRNDVGQDRIRAFRFDGNKLYLYPEEDNSRVIVWQRF